MEARHYRRCTTRSSPFANDNRKCEWPAHCRTVSGTRKVNVGNSAAGRPSAEVTANKRNNDERSPLLCCSRLPAQNQSSEARRLRFGLYSTAGDVRITSSCAQIRSTQYGHGKARNRTEAPCLALSGMYTGARSPIPPRPSALFSPISRACLGWKVWKTCPQQGSTAPHRTVIKVSIRVNRCPCTIGTKF